MQRDGMTDTIRTDADLKTDAGFKAGAKPNADAKPNAGAKPNADAKPNAGVKPNASAKKGGFPAIDASTPSYFEDITNFEEAGAESASTETSGGYIYEFGFENIPQLRKLLLERGCFTEEECTRIAVEVFRSKDPEFVRCSNGRGRQNRSAGQVGLEDGIRSGQRSEDPRDPDGQDDRRPVDFIYQL